MLQRATRIPNPPQLHDLLLRLVLRSLVGRLQDFRGTRPENDPFSRPWMPQGEAMGVEPVASITRQPGVDRQGQPPGSIQRVATQGMANGGEMDANLMRSPGMKFDIEQC